MNEKELCKKAIEAMQNSYSPYSECKVGAALLTESGKIFCGCNIENAAYSPSVCAERVAMFSAVSSGERNFSALAVAGGKGGSITTGFSPCGVCRQVMAEFCDADFPVLVVTSSDSYKNIRSHSFCPKRLHPKTLNKGFEKNIL